MVFLFSSPLAFPPATYPLRLLLEFDFNLLFFFLDLLTSIILHLSGAVKISDFIGKACVVTPFSSGLYMFYSFYRVYDAVDSGFLAYVIPGGIVRVVAGVCKLQP